jgi:hypothetical protein
MIIDAEINLLNEGLLDFFLDPDDPIVKRKKRAEKKDTDQKNKERRRLSYINKGLPVPRVLSKKNLRKYYTRKRIEVPKFLQGAENTDTDPRGDEEGIDNLVTFFAKKLNMHPGQEKKIKSSLKTAGGGIESAGSFLNNLYKKVTGTDFFSGGRVPPEEDLTDLASGVGVASAGAAASVIPGGVSPESTSTGSPGSMSSYASSYVAGIPGKQKMFYLYITNIKDFMYSHNQTDTGDIEADAENFVKSYVEGDVFNRSKTEVFEEKFALGKRIEWEKIANFIKSENSNDKSDMKKFKCGHFYVAKTPSGSTIQLKPVGTLPGVKEGELR